MAEGKAAAQAEATEWKRKYELEMAHKQRSKSKGEIYAFDFDDYFYKPLFVFYLMFRHIETRKIAQDDQLPPYSYVC